MNININENQLQEILNSQVTKGIETAFEGYTMRSTIEKIIAESVIPSLIRTAVEQATSKIDLQTLAQHLAVEISKSVTKGVQCLLREALVNIILDLKKIPEYEKEEREKERLKILQQIEKER